MSKKNKFLTISLILLLLIIIIVGSISIIKGEKDSISTLTNLIPNKVKIFLKKTIFVHAELITKKSEIEKQKKIIEFKDMTIKLLDHKLNNYFIDYIDKDYFDIDLVKFQKVIEDGEFNDEIINLKIERYVSSYLFNGKHLGARATGYLDQFENNIFLATGDGMFLYFNLSEINDGLINSKKIKSNIRSKIKTNIYNKEKEDQYTVTIIGKSIKDLKIINDEMFISFHNELYEDCFNTSILKAKINFDFLDFENFFIPDDCVKKDNKYGEFNWFHSGGRITEYKENLILFSMGEYRYRDLAQDKNSIFGKIISINKNTKEWEVVSMGHRNPQGLYYNINNDFIISTEHGPNGGDEVNLNLNPSSGKIKNFGWPISSYGYHYDNKFNQKSKAPLHKSHIKYGFQEPIKNYTPSIAISEIVKIPNQFKNDSKNSFFVASMGSILDEGDLSLHFLKFDDKFSKLKKHKIIQIGERIRDIIFIPEINKFMCYLESSGSIMLLSNNSQ